MRAIDADALTEIVQGMYAEGDDSNSYHVDAEGDTLIGKFAVIDTIFNMPTIQPKRGRWIPVTNGRGGHECDQCHEYAPCYQTGEEHLSDFCPNCGADMREVNNESD